MAHAVNYEFVAFEDYLTGERDVDVRSEYVDGHIYAMAGASELHNTVTGEFHTLLNSQAPDHCRVWQSDMKVVLQHEGKHFAYYPDIMAACEPDDNDDPYVRTNPSLVVEVLSPSTKRYDLKEKFDNYIQIPSLIEYVVVSQDTPYLQIFRRKNNWQPEAYYVDDTFTLDSLGVSITVRQIYRRVLKEVGLEVPYNH